MDLPSIPLHRPRPLWRRALRRTRRLVLPVGARLAVALLGRCPRALALHLGALLGETAWRAFRRSRSRVLGRLSLALGDRLSVAERYATGRAVYHHFGRMVLETPLMARLGAERLHEHIPVRGWAHCRERVEQLREAGRGVIVLVPHLGNWELVGALGCKTWPSALCIAKRYDVGGYQSLVERIRSQLGVSAHYQDQPLLPVVRVLRDNGVLGILPDLDARKMAGLFAPFFGRDAYTTDSPAKLALRMGSPIVVIACLRDRAGYRFISLPPLQPASLGGSPDAVRQLTQQWLAQIEGLVRRNPEQWVWMHDRWHSTPGSLARRRERARLRELARRASAPSP